MKPDNRLTPGLVISWGGTGVSKRTCSAKRSDQYSNARRCLSRGLLSPFRTGSSEDRNSLQRGAERGWVAATAAHDAKATAASPCVVQACLFYHVSTPASSEKDGAMLFWRNKEHADSDSDEAEASPHEYGRRTE